MKAIPLYKAHVPETASALLGEVLRSGQIAGDGNHSGFERKLREFLGVDSVLLTAEFSRSIEMALRMAGAGPGDSVLLSPLACLATTMPVLQTGARPVWCDIDIGTGCIDPAEIARRYTPECKAVILYHWVGVPGDVAGVLQTAGDLGVPVVEDAGEALGAELDGKRIGAHGCDYSVFSFSPVRHITTGEGAAMTFREEGKLAEARIRRKYGIPETGFRNASGEIRHECDIATPGTHNYMNRLSSVLGEAQMDALPDIVAAHRANGNYFNHCLGAIPDIQLLRTEGAVPSYWVYSFLCENRDGLRRKLKEAGVSCSAVHIRNDVYSAFGGNGPEDLPGISEFERRQLSIPCGWWVTREDREYISEVIRSGW